MSDKSSIRKGILSRRDSIDPDLKQAKDKSISERLTGLPEFASARTVLLFASFGSEVDTISLIERCFKDNKSIVLPKTNKEEGELLLYMINNIGELVPGYRGIPEPSVFEGRSMDVRNVDLVIVPGVAFDEQCNRLGYGKGYYDKLLKHRISPAIALSYEEQIVASLPAEPHDIKMDKIITDKRILNCNG